MPKRIGYSVTYPELLEHLEDLYNEDVPDAVLRLLGFSVCSRCGQWHFQFDRDNICEDCLGAFGESDENKA